ncbi:hypothetical protein BC826DRAFT_1104263 [Russula brevipes]|nr:hypothetical protein BC826DRAFT_1104263 [Russula brevipes]
MIPHFKPDVIKRCNDASINSVYDIMDMEDDRCNDLLKMDILQKQDVATFVNSYPTLDATHEYYIYEWHVHNHESGEFVVNEHSPCALCHPRAKTTSSQHHARKPKVFFLMRTCVQMLTGPAVTDAADSTRLLLPACLKSPTSKQPASPPPPTLARTTPSTASTMTEGRESITPPVGDASLPPKLEMHRRIVLNCLLPPLEPTLGLRQGE